MSSTTDSLKKSAEEVASDEPSQKKAKTADGCPVDKPVDNNNRNAAAEKGDVDNNNGASKNITNKTPCKAVNGNDAKDGDEDQKAGEADETGGENDGVFDPKIAKSLEQVENIQLEICELNEKASEEILKVEQKFNKLRRPHFEKRNELLKEIPNFWLTSLASHPNIAPMIESAEDEDCLHYMVNLDVEEFEDIKSGFRLKLHFVENPYIENDLLVKEFQLVSSDEMVSTSTPLKFKDTPQGRSLKQIVTNSVSKSKRVRGPGHSQQSFFAWLVEPLESGTDEIAEILKDQIWPNPLEFFFATPGEYETLGTDDESDDEDEEIDDEDLDDDDEVPEGINLSDALDGAEYSEDEEIEGEEEDDEDEDDDEDDEEDVE